MGQNLIIRCNYINKRDIDTSISIHRSPVPDREKEFAFYLKLSYLRYC